MHSYHVYFSLKESVSRAEMEEVMRVFVSSEVEHNFMSGSRLLHMKDKASAKDILDYHFIADYATLADRDKAIADMATRYREEPHASLMRIVSEFRVAFSDDLIAGEDA